MSSVYNIECLFNFVKLNAKRFRHFLYCESSKPRGQPPENIYCTVAIWLRSPEDTVQVTLVGLMKSTRHSLDDPANGLFVLGASYILLLYNIIYP